MKNKRLMIYIGLGKKVVVECYDFDYHQETDHLVCYESEKNEVIAEFFDPLGYEIL